MRLLKDFRRFALAPIVLLGLALPVMAHTVTYETILSGANESPPVNSAGSGVAQVVIDDHAMTLALSVAFSDLTGTVTAAHIHCCTAVPGTATAGVATPVPSFPLFPAGVQSGTYDRTFDLTLAESWNPAFVTASGGTTLLAFNALLAGMNSGSAYLNIHTTFVGSGEIRGFFAPVPLPAGAWLLAPACAAMLGGVRRKRK